MTWSLKVLMLALLVAGCGSEPDPGRDGGARDSGSDAGPNDASADSGASDASFEDAGDSGTDAGVPDAQADAGPDDPAQLSESFAPLVRYEFNGTNGAITTVIDESARSPSVTLAVGGAMPLGANFEDGAARLSGARLEGPVLESTALRDAIVNAGSFTAELWASTDDPNQVGPARIATFSQNASRRAFTFGQVSTSLNLRLQSTETDDNGNTHEAFVPVFTNAVPHHMVVTFDGTTSTQRVYLDGSLATQEVHTDGIGFGNLSVWSEHPHRLAFGDEFGSERSWTGRIYRFAIYDTVLADGDIDRLFQAGSGDTP